MVIRSISIAGAVFAALVVSYPNHSEAAPIYDQVGGTWIDGYADSTGLSSSNHANVDSVDGRLKLTNSGGGFTPPFNTSGSVITTTIVPTSVAQWGSVVLTQQTPAGTSLSVQVLDEGDALYTDDRLPGNELGFTGPSVDLNDLPVDRTAGNSNAKFARVRLKITLTTSDVAQTPSVDSLALAWTVAQGDLSASTLANTSWPSPNGNAQGTRRTAASASPYLALRWVKAQPGDYGGALTRGSGETIFNKTFGGSGSVQEVLSALNRHTGATIWQRDLFGWNFSSETAHTLAQNGTLYISDLFSDVLLAYDTTNGASLKWTYQFFGGHGNAKVALAAGGTVYTLRTLSGYAFHPDGSIKWTRALPSGHPDPGYSQVALGTNGELYFGANTTSGGDGALYALDPATGADIWPPLPIGPYVNLAPLVDSAGDIYIANDSGAAAEKKIFAIHPNGSQKWQRSIGSTSEHWTALALRSDGTLLAERVKAYNTGTAGSIEALDTATGTLLWSVPVTSDNGAFLSDLFVDGSDGFFAKRTLVNSETNVYHVDSAGNQKWRLRHNSPGVIANFHDLIPDEDGAVYGNLYRSSPNGNTVVGLSPWTMDACVQPCNVSAGNQLTVAVTTPLPPTNLLSADTNKMQVVLDSGIKVPLQYQYDAAGKAVWIGHYTIPQGTTAGTHPFTVEANAAGIATDVVVHFASPATDSSNTGVTAAARFGVDANPCTINEICTGAVLRCGNGAADPGELCDDGNFTDGDGCDSNCTPTACGNGIRTTGETCDDGNLFGHDGCSAKCQNETILDAAAQKCVNAVNKNGSGVTATQGKLNQSCLKAAAAGSVSMSSCIVDDVGLKVQKAQAKVTETVAGLCLTPPSFAFTGATTVNSAARTQGLEVARDLLGAGLSVISSSTDAAGAACQAAIFKTSLKVLGGKAKAFLKCKKAGLAAKVLPRIVSAADLQRCFDDVEAGTADAIAKLSATAVKKCSGVALDSAFPPSAGAADFATFVHARLECRACLMFNEMDGLSENCDLFDDATANGSCS